MLLDDALTLLECPICLQRLGYERGQNCTSSGPISVSDTDSSYALLTRLCSSASIDKHNTGDDASEDDSYSNGGIAVLMCGHMLHYLCVMQLYEYTKQASCPVCRAPVEDASCIVRFAPRNKFAARTTTSTTMPHSPSSSSASSSLPFSTASSYSNTVVSTPGVAAPTSRESDLWTNPRLCQPVTTSLSCAVASDDNNSRHQAGHHSSRSHATREMDLASRRAGGADDVATHTRKRHRPDGVEENGGGGQVEDEEGVGHAVRTVWCDADDSKPMGEPNAREQDLPATATAAVAAAVDGGSSGHEDVTIVGTRHVPQSDVYHDRLLRVTSLYNVRAETLVARKDQLQSSLRQLTEDCKLLGMTVSAARQRYEMMCSDGEMAHVDELRRLCAETKRACDSATAELASTMRTNVQLKRRVEKYTRKLRR